LIAKTPGIRNHGISVRFRPFRSEFEQARLRAHLIQKEKRYDPIMQQNEKIRGSQRTIGRALIEIAFIVFLFYSNLLMGEFTVANGHGKTLSAALMDIFTGANFLIAITSALIGYLVFEFLRKKL
jgi:hypothetical protein